MNNDIDRLTSLNELWEWCKQNRESAWKFPEKDGVMGYLGSLPLCIVADCPGNRSRKHRQLGLAYSNDLDIFTNPWDYRFYESLRKYGLQNAHLMHAHISVIPDIQQDRHVFLKQIEIIKPEALLIMGTNRKKKWSVWRTVARYFHGWNGVRPRMYSMFNYSDRFVSNVEWDRTLRSALIEIATNHPSLSGVLRVIRRSEMEECKSQGGVRMAR
jgi:hypothetical protein